MPQFLRVVLPLAIVFLFGFLLEYRAEVGADRTRFLTQETSLIQRGVRQVEREFETATLELFFVADLVAGAVDDNAPSGFAELERSLLTLVSRRADYAQVRFISVAGQEILRVENTSAGPRIVPEHELQDKSDRDYFTEAMRLQAGEVFVSPMELNIERGEVEKPYKPVIRLLTPLDDGGGTRRGVVVLNLHGERFLRGFERNPEKGSVQRMIVNSDGYWIQYRPEAEWGFMLEHGRGFHNTFPDIWEPLTANRQGQAESSDSVFLFDTVSPRPSAAIAGAETHGQSDWMLISLVPREVLDGIAVRVATRLLVIAMPFFFALLLVCLLLAAAVERRRLADEALRSVEHVRSSMMRAALDAIVVMDETGTTLEFNPAAQEIFGYTFEEARGKLVADLIIPPAHREAHRVGLEHYLKTGEGPIIDKHIYGITGIRKNGSTFPVELTVCPIPIAGKKLFCGFLRDLSKPESEGEEVSA
jgi:PAS domain S-box-containing protein